MYSKTSFGPYGQLEASKSTFRVLDRSVEDAVSVAAVTLGFIARIEGSMPGGAKFGTNKLLVAPFIGATARIIGSGAAERREAIFGTRDRDFWGLEVGTIGQLGNLILELKLTALTNHTRADGNWVGTRVPGLTGGEIQVNASFLLPWSVLGAK